MTKFVTAERESQSSNDSQFTTLPSTSTASTCDNDFPNDEDDDDMTEAEMCRFLEQSNDEGKTNADKVDKLAVS